MNEIAHGKFGIGAPLRRKEDSALITGKGSFTDDVQSGRHAACVHCPLALCPCKFYHQRRIGRRAGAGVSTSCSPPSTLLI